MVLHVVLGPDLEKYGGTYSLTGVCMLSKQLLIKASFNNLLLVWLLRFDLRGS